VLVARAQRIDPTVKMPAVIRIARLRPMRSVKLIGVSIAPGAILNQVLHARCASDVSLNGHRSSAHLFDRHSGFLSGFRVAMVIDDNIGALFRQAECDCLADWNQ
jgi:hypothetical protein